MRNSDLWLKEKDTDWHLPILVTLRESPLRNWRQRSEAAQAKRDQDKLDHKAKVEREKQERLAKKQAKQWTWARPWQSAWQSTWNWEEQWTTRAGPYSSSSAAWQHREDESRPDDWRTQ